MTELKTITMNSENIQADDFETKQELVQKIKFAFNLDQLRKVVEHSSGDYVELAVGVTSRSEFVAVIYSNGVSAKTQYDANGKPCPPSTKCPK